MEIRIDNVRYSYKSKYQTVEALKGVSCEFVTGKFYAIIGPSGSGKTTLLSLMGGLDLPSEGTITIDGKDIRKMDLDRLRRDTISIVYQSFNLFPLLNARENVAFPLEMKKIPRRQAESLAEKCIIQAGLTEKIFTQRPLGMSGGEQQRVAIARALASDGSIILADEPTGNLDTENGRLIIELLKKMAHENERIVVVITHNPEIAAVADAVYSMKDGLLHAKREVAG